MNHKFDELAKGLAQSATRRGALKKFGLGLAGLALVCFGLANRVEAAKSGCKSAGRKWYRDSDCCSNLCVQSLGPKHNGGVCI